MASFNPYAKRKRGIIGSAWDAVADNVSAPSPGSVAGAAVRMAGGRAATGVREAHRIALRKAEIAKKLGITAGKAAESASVHAMRLAAPAVNRAADTLRAVKEAAPNKLAALRSAVTTANEDVRIARGLEELVPDSTGLAIRRTRLARAEKRFIKNVINPLGKKLSSTPVRSAGDLARRATSMSTARAAMTAETAPLRAAINQVAVDKAFAEQALQVAQANQTAALDALKVGGDRIRRAVVSAEEAFQAAGQRASEIAGRAANRARVNILKRTPGMTGLQRATLAAERSVNTAASAVKSTLGRATGATARALRQLVPVALKPTTNAVATTAGKTVGKSLARKIVPRMLLAIPTGGANLAVEGAARGLAAGFNALEKGVVKLAGSGASRTLGGKLFVGATRAGSTAGGFALGAWIDAGMKAYDFYQSGGKLSDVGKDFEEEMTVNGRKVTVQRHNPGWGDIIFSKDYAKESLKGLQSALTLGFFGNGDNTVIDGWFDDEKDGVVIREGENPNEQFVDVNGNPVYTKEEIDAQNTALATAKEKSDRAKKFVKSAGMAGEQNLRTLMALAQAERADALRQVEINSRNWEEFSGSSRALRGKTVDGYVSSATQNAESEFKRKMGYIIANPDAKKVMEANRDTAYQLYYGRNYRDDSSAATLSEQNDAAFRDFNREWAEASDIERLTWDKDAESKRIREVEKAAYEASLKEES